MAGTFGFDAEHHAVSMQMAESSWALHVARVCWGRSWHPADPHVLPRQA
jgi:hypothetical protein